MHARKPLRLRGYDYTSHGAYLVTVSVSGKLPLLGTIRDDGVHLTLLGRSVRDALRSIPDHSPGVGLDEHVVMPDHVHAILLLPPPDEVERPVTLGTVIGTFKAAVTRECRGSKMWQRGYHDRVIRNERELLALREYVAANPSRYRR